MRSTFSSTSAPMLDSRRGAADATSATLSAVVERKSRMLPIIALRSIITRAGCPRSSRRRDRHRREDLRERMAGTESGRAAKAQVADRTRVFDEVDRARRELVDVQVEQRANQQMRDRIRNRQALAAHFLERALERHGAGAG